MHTKHGNTIKQIELSAYKEYFVTMKKVIIAITIKTRPTIFNKNAICDLERPSGITGII